jgi:hypothetical protein
VRRHVTSHPITSFGFLSQTAYHNATLHCEAAMSRRID